VTPLDLEMSSGTDYVPSDYLNSLQPISYWYFTTSVDTELSDDDNQRSTEDSVNEGLIQSVSSSGQCYGAISQ